MSTEYRCLLCKEPNLVTRAEKYLRMCEACRQKERAESRRQKDFGIIRKYEKGHEQ